MWPVSYTHLDVYKRQDFAAYYAVNLEENGEGISSIPVTVSLMNEWGAVSYTHLSNDRVTAKINLFKVDKETGKAVPQGDACLLYTSRCV